MLMGIGWFSAVFPIRLIWLQFAFQFIGGGSAVANTMLNVMATDVTPAEMRYGIAIIIGDFLNYIV